MEPMLGTSTSIPIGALFFNLWKSVESVDPKLLSAHICEICGSKFVTGYLFSALLSPSANLRL
jgi:hypothetical protein